MHQSQRVEGGKSYSFLKHRQSTLHRSVSVPEYLKVTTRLLDDPFERALRLSLNFFPTSCSSEVLSSCFPVSVPAGGSDFALLGLESGGVDARRCTSGEMRMSAAHRSSYRLLL